MKNKLLIAVISIFIVGALSALLNVIEPVKTEFIHERIKKKNAGPDSRPSEWMWLQRTYPHYQADDDAYQLALEQKRIMEMSRDKNYFAKKLSIPVWKFAGPENIGGRVSDIEFNKVNPNIVYAGTATGGVFKSTNMGSTWFPIFDAAPNLNIGDIAIDPNNPNIIYAGTGEGNGGHNNFPGAGVFKSTDAGATWSLKGLPNTATIGRIIVDHSNSQNVYVAAIGSYFSPNPERGVFKSTNGGETWFSSLFVSDTTGAVDLLMDPNNSNFLMATTWERVRRPNSTRIAGASSGIYRSTNAGVSWIKLGASNGLPTGTAIGRIGITMSLSNPNILYALYTNGSEYSGFYKTTNKGDTWTNADPSLGIVQGTSTFSWFFGQTRVHPTNPDIVYALDVAFMRSTNSGATWPIVYGYTGPSHLHVDHHALAFHPTNPNYILSGNDGGINISTDAGVTWSNPVHLPATQFYEIGLDFNNPNRLYGGTQDNNTIRTLTGSLIDWDRIYGGDGFYVIVDYTNSNIIYAESQFGNLVKSTNGGLSFVSVRNGITTTEPTNWSTPVVMDPNNNNVLYYGTNRLYRTTNGAASWTAISTNLTNSTGGTRLGTITTIAVAPTNSNVIYAGTDDSNIWVTTNRGTNWSKISNASLPNRWVTRVTVSPTLPGTLYVTYSGLKWRDPQPHVFKTTNYGVTWQNISSNLPDAPVNAFAVDNNYPNRLYLGSDIGVFVSFNGGLNWEVLGTGIPAVVMNDMKIHPVTNELIVGTHGRSMYKIKLDSVTTSANDELPQSPNSFILNQNYPNPFNPSTIISWQMERAGKATLIIYNTLGKEVADLVNGYFTKGEHKVNFDASAFGLTSGVYFYRLETSKGTSITKKLVYMK